MASNMYRVGDYVYFENASTAPYQIRRIEELTKTQNGSVEAKAMCFLRRRDITSNLIHLADKSENTIEENTDLSKDSEDVLERKRHQLRHRELFLSRTVETLPATHIRGKCTVSLLNETEGMSSYLNKEDSFYYTLVYDTSMKTLLADKGEIRVGQKYQADANVTLIQKGDKDIREGQILEELVWKPPNTAKDENGKLIACPINDRQIDQFMIVARSVGTFARALDCTSTIRQPSLHMSAASASRDITLFHGMNTLHNHNYNLSKAISDLVPTGGPVLCRDEIEEWSASEANLFEEALVKYNKDFNEIKEQLMPWKSLKSIIEYYYMWKTTDRYVQKKRVKAALAESKLKQVYIPPYNKLNPALIPQSKFNGNEHMMRPCEGCYVAHSAQWYSWGPSHINCRLCHVCWTYWRRYGGLKNTNRAGVDHSDDTSSAASLKQQQQQSQQPPSLVQQNQLTGRGITSSTAASAGSASTGQPVDHRVKSHLPSHHHQQHHQHHQQHQPPPLQHHSQITAGATSLTNHNQQQHAMSSSANQIDLSQSHPCTIPDCGKEFKLKNHLLRHLATSHGLTNALRCDSSSPRPAMKTRAAFCLHTTPLTRVSRQLCAALLSIRSAARQPFSPLNIGLIKQMCSEKLGIPESMKLIKKIKAKKRDNLIIVAGRIGIPVDTAVPDCLKRSEDHKTKQKELESKLLPLPQHHPLSRPLHNNNSQLTKSNGHMDNEQSTPLPKKRSYDQTNGSNADDTASKRAHTINYEGKQMNGHETGPLSSLGLQHAVQHSTTNANNTTNNNSTNTNNNTTTNTTTTTTTTTPSGTPVPQDDDFFVATPSTKKIRRQLTTQQFKAAARKPWRMLTAKKQLQEIKSQQINNSLLTNGEPMQVV